MKRGRALLVVAFVFLLVGCVGCSGRQEVREKEIVVEKEVTRVTVVREVITPTGGSPTATATPTVTSTSTLSPTVTTVTPIPDSVLDYGIDRDSDFTVKEAELAIQVFNGKENLGRCVLAARNYLEGQLKEGAPQWGPPARYEVPLSTSFTLNGVELKTTSKVAFKLRGEEGEEGWLYEVTAPAGTFVSQLACRNGELYTYNASIERDGVAYFFVWRDGLSRAFFMGGCANFGVVERYLPAPTSVPPTKEADTPPPATETPCPTNTAVPSPVPTETSVRPTETPEPTATPPPEPTPQPATRVPTATAEPKATPTERPTDAPPPPTEVPATATPVPPVVDTPEKNPTATP